MHYHYLKQDHDEMCQLKLPSMSSVKLKNWCVVGHEKARPAVCLMRMIARDLSLVWAKSPAAPPQQPKFVNFDVSMSSLLPARQPAAAGDCMRAVTTLRKKSQQHSLQGGKGDFLHNSRFVTTRVTSSPASALEDAEKKDIDPKMQCTTCPELHLPGTIYCSCKIGAEHTATT